MRAALAAHQASFLSEALPMASTSALAQAPAKETKSVWEMDDADFEEDDNGEEDSEEAEDEEEELEEQEELVANQKQRASIPFGYSHPGRRADHPAPPPSAAVVAFVEPGRGDTAGSAFAAPAAPLNKRELRDFKVRFPSPLVLSHTES